AMTYELRVGTSICDSRLRSTSRPMTTGRLDTKGMAIRHRFEGRCVNTMVRTRPMRLASGTAANIDSAEQMLVQKNRLAAAATDRPKVWNSHSASMDCTIRPPEKESTQNRAARR